MREEEGLSLRLDIVNGGKAKQLLKVHVGLGVIPGWLDKVSEE